MPQMRQKYDPVFRDRDCAGLLKRRRSRWLQSLVSWVPTVGAPPGVTGSPVPGKFVTGATSRGKSWLRGAEAATGVQRRAADGGVMFPETIRGRVGQGGDERWAWHAPVEDQRTKHAGATPAGLCTAGGQPVLSCPYVGWCRAGGPDAETGFGAGTTRVQAVAAALCEGAVPCSFRIVDPIGSDWRRGLVVSRKRASFTA